MANEHGVRNAIPRAPHPMLRQRRAISGRCGTEQDRFERGLIAAALVAFLPSAAGAAGFAVDYESALALGTATAGSAAARDASTIFYNAAGLGFLDRNE